MKKILLALLLFNYSSGFAGETLNKTIQKKTFINQSIVSDKEIRIVADEIILDNTTISAPSIVLIGNQSLTLKGQTSLRSSKGQIDLLGKKIDLLDQTLVTSRISSSGGTIRIGGDHRGENNDLLEANTVFIGKDVLINADAGRFGNGGDITVWSNLTTEVNGFVSAKGGTLSGNGGFIEISSEKNWRFDNWASNVSLSAPKGESGQFLLDPNDISIVDGSGSPIGSSPVNSNTINDQDIVDFLTGVGNLTIETSGTGGNGDVTIDGAVSINYGTGNDLTINADRTITVNAGAQILCAVDGNIRLEAARNIVMNTGSLINSSSGDVTLAANTSGFETGSFTAIELNGAIASTTSGTVSIQGTGGTSAASRGIYLRNSSNVIAGLGNVIMIGTAVSDSAGGTASGIVVSGSTISGGVSVHLTGTGGSSPSEANGLIVVSNGTVQATGSGTVTVNAYGGNSGSDDYAIKVALGGKIKSADGDVILTCNAGSAGTNEGLGVILNGVLGDAAQTGDFTIVSDDVDLGSASVSGTGHLTFRILNTASMDSTYLGPSERSNLVDGFTAIVFENATSVSSTMLTNYSDSVIVKSRVNMTSHITMGSEAIVFTSDVVALASFTSIWASSIYIESTGSLALDASSENSIHLYGTAHVNCPVTLGIDGNTAGTDHNQIIIQDSLILGANATLNLAGSFAPSNGSIKIIQNNSSSALNGIFQGLPQDDTLTFNSLLYKIVYNDGGNDVALERTDINPPVNLVNTGDTILINDTIFLTNVKLQYSDIEFTDAQINIQPIITGEVEFYNTDNPGIQLFGSFTMQDINDNKIFAVHIAGNSNPFNIYFDAYETFNAAPTDTFRVVVLNPAGVDKDQQENNLSASPNPASDALTLSGLNEETWYLCDIFGSLLAEGNDSNVNVNGLSPGVYIISTGRQTLRFIKE